MKKLLSSILATTLLGACIHVHAPSRVVVQCRVAGKVSMINLEDAKLVCTIKATNEKRKR